MISAQTRSQVSVLTGWNEAFPDRYDVPSKVGKFGNDFSVSLDIVLELLVPEFRVGGWSRCITASGVPVPETAMDKNHGSVFRKDQIRSPGKGPDVFPVAEATGKQIFPKCHFRAGVCAPDPGHIITSCLFRFDVHREVSSLPIL